MRIPWWAWAWPAAAWLVLLLTPFLQIRGFVAAIAGAALIATVFAAVYHAEVVAHRTGEPFGTLVLAVAVLAALFAIPVASAVETTLPWQPVQTKPAVHALVLRGQALNRIYHLGSYARTSAPKVKASTVLKPTAVTIAANPTGGSANKVQHVFSIH